MMRTNRNRVRLLEFTLAVMIAISAVFLILPSRALAEGLEEPQEKAAIPTANDSFIETDSGIDEHPTDENEELLPMAIASGTCGTCEWRIDENGTLTIGAGVLDGNGWYGDWPWYDHRTTITSVVSEGVVVATESLASMFADYPKLTSVNLSDWDTSSVTDMSSMFRNCTKLSTLDLSGWDTSLVESMNSMFYDCSKLASLVLSGWDTSSVKDMGYMFQGCARLSSLDLSGWDTSSVADLSCMFYNCTRLSSLDLSGWDTSSATNMWGVFLNCSSLDNLDISSWDTSSVKDLSHMFQGCTKMSSLDLSSWNTSLVTYARAVFFECSSLESVDLSGWDTSSVADMGSMFADCLSLESVDLSGWDTSSVINTAGMFSGCSSLQSLDLSDWDTSSVADMSVMFYECSSLESLDLSSWDISLATDVSSMFSWCSSLVSLDLSSWDTSSAVDMSWMFGSCEGLRCITLGENFSFFGASNRRLCELPEGDWISASNGTFYTHDAIPDGVADTYYLQSFSDVDRKTAHVGDIAWLAAEGISTGWDVYGMKEFRPYANVARADMAAFLFRLAKLWGIADESWQPSGKASFRDVSAKTPHYREVMWLAESGISEGWKVAGGRREFRPYANVARADMAAFLFRLAKMAGMADGSWQPGGGASFRDVNAKTAHFREVMWLAERGISKGWDVAGGREFRPYANVARADMAAFLHRLDGLR